MNFKISVVTLAILLGSVSQSFAECLEKSSCVVKASACHSDGLNMPSSYNDDGGNWRYTANSKSIFTMRVIKECWGDRQGPFEVVTIGQDEYSAESPVHSYPVPQDETYTVVQNASEQDRRTALSEATVNCNTLRTNKLNELISCGN